MLHGDGPEIATGPDRWPWMIHGTPLALELEAPSTTTWPMVRRPACIAVIRMWRAHHRVVRAVVQASERGVRGCVSVEAVTSSATLSLL